MCSKTRKCEQLPGWGGGEYGRPVAMPYGRSWELHEDNRGMNLKIPQATDKGYVEVEPYGAFDWTYPNSLTRRGRVQGGVISALPYCVRMRFMYMRQIPFNPMEDGTCRPIKSQYYKNGFANFVRGGGGMERLPLQCTIVGQIWKSRQNGMVYDPMGIAPCLCVGNHSGVEPKIIEYEKQ